MLSRVWSNLPKLSYIMLNPSTADEINDDKTIKRLIYFTQKFGYGGFYVGNIYSKITPHVIELYKNTSHNEKKNISAIKEIIEKSYKVVFAWGKTIDSEPEWLKNLVKKPLCFGFNKNGSPKHPLYLNKESSLFRWR